MTTQTASSVAPGALAASVEATATASARPAGEVASPAAPPAPEQWGGGCECWVTPERMWFRYGSAVEPGSQIEQNPDCPMHPSPRVEVPPSAPDCDDRAVRLALGWGAANLRLALVRDALKDCCEPDRNRILGAIGRESK